jgi:hypothetical protein
LGVEGFQAPTASQFVVVTPACHVAVVARETSGIATVPVARTINSNFRRNERIVSSIAL